MDQADLQRWDLAVPMEATSAHQLEVLGMRDSIAHENTSQIQLYLEADVDIGTVDSWTPPKRKATIGDLVETRALRVGKLLVTHRLFETGRLFPE